MGRNIITQAQISHLGVNVGEGNLQESEINNRIVKLCITKMSV